MNPVASQKTCNLHEIQEKYRRLYSIRDEFIKDPIFPECASWSLDNFLQSVEDQYVSRGSKQVAFGRFKFNELALLNQCLGHVAANQKFSSVIQSIFGSLAKYSSEFSLFRDRNNLYAVVSLNREIEISAVIKHIHSTANSCFNQIINQLNFNRESPSAFETNYQEITSPDLSPELLIDFQEEIFEVRGNRVAHKHNFPLPPIWSSPVQRQLEFYRTFQSSAPNSSREEAIDFYRSLMGEIEIDPLTRLYKGKDRNFTLENILQLVKRRPDLSAYSIEVDVHNLGGVNRTAGRDCGNELLRFVAFAIPDSLSKSKCALIGFRIGGDELGFIISSKSDSEKLSFQEVNEAMDRVQSAINTNFQKHQKIAHAKHPTDPRNNGVGIVFSIVPIDGKKTVSELTQISALQIEQNKLTYCIPSAKV